MKNVLMDIKVMVANIKQFCNILKVSQTEFYIASKLNIINFAYKFLKEMLIDII